MSLFNVPISPNAPLIKEGSGGIISAVWFHFITGLTTPFLKLNPYNISTLPAAGKVGRYAYVTDATTPSYLGNYIGNGTVICAVFDNGTNWVTC